MFTVKSQRSIKSIYRMKIACQKTTEMTLKPETLIFERSTVNAPNQTIPTANVKVSSAMLDNPACYLDTHHGIRYFMLFQE